MKGWIIVLIMILIIGGITAFAYLKVEKPIKEAGEQIFNISLYSIDSFTGDSIETNYEIYVSGIKNKEGRTLKDGSVLLRYPKNSSIFAKSTNKTYYNSEIQILSNEQNLTRAELSLDRPGNLTIIPLNRFFDWDNNITFNLSTDYNFKNLIICSEWSYAVVYVRTSFSQTDSLNTFDRCWNTGLTIKRNEPQNITFDYKVMNSFNSEDYIKLYFIDSENGVTGINESKDYWSENKNYTLSGIPPETGVIIL